MTSKTEINQIKNQEKCLKTTGYPICIFSPDFTKMLATVYIKLVYLSNKSNTIRLKLVASILKQNPKDSLKGYSKVGEGALCCPGLIS